MKNKNMDSVHSIIIALLLAHNELQQRVLKFNVICLQSLQNRTYIRVNIHYAKLYFCKTKMIWMLIKIDDDD